jgi:UDP-2-acetamido-2,6-beta-L-arabino-hexul-4-ose reductase
MTTIGITGGSGFIGGHLALYVQRQPGGTALCCPRAAWDDPGALRTFVSRCHAIVHLAGMNRGEDSDVYSVNTSLAHKLASALADANAKPHVLFASSTQDSLDTAYGQSKRDAGAVLARWAEQACAPMSVLVIPNVYGAGCRPFYNSVVATFCHELAHGEVPQVHIDKEIELISVNDLLQEIWSQIQNPPSGIVRRRITGAARMTVSRLLTILHSLRDSYFDKDAVPDLSDPTIRSLYATFLSYLPAQRLTHCPPLHTDQRGSLAEIIKLAQAGQVFFSTTKPGVTRGNHYHTRKVEWFCVVRGKAAIRLRRVGTNKVDEFNVCGDAPQFISIPVMHAHHIENVGEDELLTMFWSSEIFSAEDADTFFEKVT